MTRSKGFIAAFVGDTRGAVFIYVTILLPLLIGFALLAIDGGRMFNLQTSLQDAADAFALAGAAELDRRSGAPPYDAISRANNAIDTLVDNQSKFSVAGLTNVTVESRRYLHSLPATDSTPIDNTFVTTDPVEARFVEVVVTPATLNTIFPLWISQAWARQTSIVGGRAVAGFTAAVCQFTPLFMCNPYEGSGTSIFQAAESHAMRRQQLQLRMIGPNAAYFPGNFAFLISDETLPGANALREALARVHPETCYSAEGVDTKPGQNVGPVSQGLNTRFDMWDGSMNSKKNNAEYRPSRNVRKGYKPGNGAQGACNPDPPPQPGSMKLPRDDSFSDLGGGRMGNGIWDWQLYWTTNFCPAGLGSCPAGNAPAAEWSQERPTRYEVYRYEIDHNLPAYQSPGGERGTPMCSNSQTNDTPDRRIIYAAIINCQEEGPLQGSEENIPVLTFAEFFLTESVAKPGQVGEGDIMVELKGLLEPGGFNNNIIRDVVQLYR